MKFFLKKYKKMILISIITALILAVIGGTFLFLGDIVKENQYKEEANYNLDNIIIDGEGSFVNIINEIVTKYKIETRDEFDFINIDGYDYQYGENKLMVPIKRIEIAIPGNAVVSEIIVNRSTPQSLSSLNIPVDGNCPDCIGCGDCVDLIQANESTDIFNITHRSREIKTDEHKEVLIDIFPVEYNPTTGQAILYKNIEIKVKYSDTDDKGGILLGTGSSGQIITSGEIFYVYAYIQNTTNQVQQFNVEVELKNKLNKKILSKKELITIDSGLTDEVKISLVAPQMPGGYWVNTNVFNKEIEIGNSSHHININLNSGKITNIDIVASEDNEGLIFNITYHNLTNKEVDVAIGLEIMDEFIEFIPIVYTVPAKGKQVSSRTWKNLPPEYNFAEKYSVIATAKMNGTGYFIDSKIKEYSIRDYIEIE